MERGRAVPIVIQDPNEFHRACAVLQESGLLVKSQMPGGRIGLSTLMYGHSGAAGTVWVPAFKGTDAERVLKEAGIEAFSPSVAIVDVSDPRCPHCCENLEPGGPSQCGQCGMPFQWIDIDEPETDPTGVLCRKCGYDLTGNTSGRCPECAALLPCDVGSLVQVANPSSGPGGSGEAAEWVRSLWREAWPLVVAVLGVTAGAALIAGVGRGLEVWDPDMAGPNGLMITALLILVAVLIVLERRSKRIAKAHSRNSGVDFPNTRRSRVMTEPEHDNDLQTVVVAKTEFEAHAVVAVLKEAGIEAFAFGYVKQALPLDMKFTSVPVQVRAEDLQHAKKELKQNVSDSVDLDWDEIDVGEREDEVPLSSERRMPAALRAIVVIAIVILLVLIVRFGMTAF